MRKMDDVFEMFHLTSVRRQAMQGIATPKYFDVYWLELVGVGVPQGGEGLTGLIVEARVNGYKLNNTEQGRQCREMLDAYADENPDSSTKVDRSTASDQDPK